MFRLFIQALKSFLKAIWSDKLAKLQVIIVILTIISAVIYYQYKHQSFEKQWNDWINTLITILTLCVAVAVWINEKVTSWESSLSKKLDIEYYINDNLYASVINAPLSGVDDIRQWGISIAGTILNNRVNIAFSGFKTFPPKRKGEIMNYRLTVFLLQQIEGISQGSRFIFGDNGNLLIDEEN